MKKMFRYIRNIFIIFLSLLVIVILISQTGFFKDFLRDVITDKLNDSIDGKLLIGEIQGDLFSNIEIENINLTKDNSPLISVKRMEINYNLFSLLENKINIHSLRIDSIEFNLIQQKDSTWNISSVFKSSGDTSSTPFDWAVYLDEFQIQNSRFSISPLDTASSFSKRLENINLQLSGVYTGDKNRLHVKHFSFNSVDPLIKVKNLELIASGSRNEIKVSDINLETGLNKIHAEGDISLIPFNFKSNIKTGPITMSEFSSLTSFRFKKGSPSLFLDLTKKDNSVHLESVLSESNQRVKIDLHLTDYPALKGSAAVSVTNLSLSELFGDNSPDGLVNGNFNLKGVWINENDSQIELTGNLFNSYFLKRNITRSNISAQLNKGILKSDLSLDGDFGSININSVIDQIFNGPSYSFQSTTENLNLSRILLIDSLNSDLNLTLNGEGTNFNPDYISGHLQIDIE